MRGRVDLTPYRYPGSGCRATPCVAAEPLAAQLDAAPLNTPGTFSGAAPGQTIAGECC